MHRKTDEEPGEAHEEPADEGWDTDDDPSETIPCPTCRAPIYEEAQRCPHCGDFVVHAESAESKPWWVVVAAGLCLAVVLYWLIAPFL